MTSRRLLAVGSAAVALSATTTALSASARPAQAGPEYGIVVAAIAGGFQATKPIYTCSGVNLGTVLTGAIGGPAAVQKLAVEVTAQTLGSRQKPWPTNTRAFTYEGRRWVPDFVKGRTLYLVQTGPLNLREIRDLREVARSRGGELVVITRRSAGVGPSLSKAASQWWSHSAGRVRIVRCI